MPPTQQLIPGDAQAAWERALEDLPHAFGHTWTNCAAMARTTGASTWLYAWESEDARAVCPVAERSYGRAVDVCTPYGFSGFTGSGNWSPALADWKRFAGGRGWVCGYLVINPALANVALFDPEDVRTHNELYLWDLRPAEAELFAALSDNRRRQVRAAERPLSPIEIDTPACRRFVLDHFNAFYESRSARSVYRLSDATLEMLLSSPHTMLVGARGTDGIEAVSTFVYTPYVADYFAGIHMPAGRSWSAALLWQGALALKQRGVPVLNLGGGVVPGDGIADFKARFGTSKAPLSALAQIYQPDTFVRLCEEAGVKPDDPSGYFPPYRRVAAPGETTAAHSIQKP
jgi:hypothetical protein